MKVFREINVFKKGWMLLGVLVFILTSCEKEKTEEPIVEKEPIELDCNYFNEDRILENDPERPIDYVISCEMRIRGTKVEVEPGTVIAFTQNGSISLQSDNEGSFRAVGTADQAIVFKGTSSQKGHWKGVKIKSGNQNNEIKHAVIRDAGQTGSGLEVSLNGDLRLTHTTFENNKDFALEIDGLSQASYKDKSIVKVSDNDFKNNDKALRINSNKIEAIEKSNTFTDNEADYIEVVSANTLEDATWYNHGLAYRMTSGIELRSKITIEAGVEIEMPQGSAFYVENGAPGIKAIGTKEDPIVITGIEKTPEYWRGIKISSSWPENEFRNVIVEYIGNGATGGSNFRNFMVNGSSYMKINDVTFNHVHPSYCAIQHSSDNSNLDIGNVTVSPSGCVSQAY